MGYASEDGGLKITHMVLRRKCVKMLMSKIAQSGPPNCRRVNLEPKCVKNGGIGDCIRDAGLPDFPICANLRNLWIEDGLEVVFAICVSPAISGLRPLTHARGIFRNSS